MARLWEQWVEHVDDVESGYWVGRGGGRKGGTGKGKEKMVAGEEEKENDSVAMEGVEGVRTGGEEEVPGESSPPLFACGR